MARKSSTKIRTADYSAVKTPASAICPETPAITRQWSWLYYLAASFVLALIAYSPSLNGSFIFDDRHLPMEDAHVNEQPVRFWIGGSRPILMASYWFNFLIDGLRPFGYHLTNIFLHAACAVLILFIFDRIFVLADRPLPRRAYALIGAGLFLLHPLQTESVDYIAGRSEVVAGLFFLAAWLLFLRNFESDTNLLLTLKLCLLAAMALLSKESTITLPALFLLTDFYFAKNSIVQQMSRRLKLYVLFLVGGVAGAVVILRRLPKSSNAGLSSGINPLLFALTECRAILTYLRLFFIPAGQNADWQMPLYRSLNDGAAAFYLIGFLGLIAATVWLYRRERLASFGLAAFLIMLSPTSSIVPIRDALAERRMYLPIAGLIIAVLALASKIEFTSVWRRTAAIVCLGLCTVLSYQRSLAWVSEYDLWGASVRANPDNYRAHFGMGLAMMLRSDCAGAVKEFSIARTQEKSDSQVLWDLAAATECAKRPAEALALYRTYAVTEPNALVYDQIGYLEATLGNAGPSIDAFEHALKLDPNNASAYAHRGMARFALKDPAGARADFVRALQIDPANANASAGLARLSR